VLAQIVFLLLVLGCATAGTMLESAVNARNLASLDARAALAPAVASALANYEVEVGSIVVAATPGDVSAFPAETIVQPTADGSIATSVRITPQTPSMPTCDVQAVSVGADVARNLNCAPSMQESRLAVRFDVLAGPQAADGSIVPFARGGQTVMLRLFAQAPYVAVVGVRSLAEHAGAHEADLGGNGPPLATFGPAGSNDGDTSLHVIYACAPALGDCSESQPPDPDVLLNRAWDDGNGLSN
jgi:hypothetical protein